MKSRNVNTLLYPYSVRLGPNGTIYVTDTYNHRIRKLNREGLSTAISSGDGKMIKFPCDLAFGNGGDIFISDSDFSQIVKQSGSSGLLKPMKALIIDNRSSDFLAYPSQIDFFEDRLYIADTMRDRIVTLDCTTLQGTSISVKRPLGIVVNRKTKEITFTQKSVNSISVIRSGQAHVLAGSLIFGLSDGQGQQAAFFDPIGLSSRSDGSIVVADAGNHSIRIIDPEGYVVTLAGTRRKGHQDGKDAQFNYPMGVAATEDGCVIVADTYNHSVRKILPNLEVETLV